MYGIAPINGNHLPHKTLCLTYDDGPGEYTLPIAQFLFEQGIKATFFVVGKYAIEQPVILSRLAEMGHIIGNHTYDHPDLPYYVSINGDLQSQVLRTDAIIKPYIDHPIFFRAPYGKWSAETANELNIYLPAAINHIGPVHWDIGGIDCYYWQTGKSVATALAEYKKMIDDAGKGIVVMHDDISDMDVVKPSNQTLALTQQLIPLLQADGYRFVGLDEVVANQADKASLQVYLQVKSKQVTSLQTGNSSEEFTLSNKKKTIFEIEELRNGKIALRTLSDKYLSLADHHQTLTSADGIAPYSSFDFIPVFDNRFLLRACSGNFVNVNNSTGRLEATATYMRLAAIFTCQPVQTTTVKPISLRMHYQLWKKKLAFIKSKLFNQ